MSDTRQHLHELIERLSQAQLAAAEKVLHAMVDEDELTEEDRRAVAASRQYFENGGQGVPFEEVVAECGFTMDQIRSKAD